MKGSTQINEQNVGVVFTVSTVRHTGINTCSSSHSFSGGFLIIFLNLFVVYQNREAINDDMFNFFYAFLIFLQLAN
jgi:hypothetical protein